VLAVKLIGQPRQRALEPAKQQLRELVRIDRWHCVDDLHDLLEVGLTDLLPALCAQSLSDRCRRIGQHVCRVGEVSDQAHQTHDVADLGIGQTVDVVDDDDEPLVVLGQQPIERCFGLQGAGGLVAKAPENAGGCAAGAHRGVHAGGEPQRVQNVGVARDRLAQANEPLALDPPAGFAQLGGQLGEEVLDQLGSPREQPGVKPDQPKAAFLRQRVQRHVDHRRLSRAPVARDADHEAIRRCVPNLVLQARDEPVTTELVLSQIVDRLIARRRRVR
jgi:hypothetical protein